jgi:hypothetical protein
MFSGMTVPVSCFTSSAFRFLRAGDPLSRRRLYGGLARVPDRRIDRRPLLNLGAAAVPQGFRSGDCLI